MDNFLDTREYYEGLDHFIEGQQAPQVDADRCRQCGCHEMMACNHIDVGPCWWMEEATDQQGPLCSHCLMENDGELEPGSVERPWLDKETLP